MPPPIEQLNAELNVLLNLAVYLLIHFINLSLFHLAVIYFLLQKCTGVLFNSLDAIHNSVIYSSAPDNPNVSLAEYKVLA